MSLVSIMERVTWPPFRRLAENIDALAVTLATPGYEKLVDIEDAPFQFKDKIEVDLFQYYSLSPNGFVTGSFLTENPTAASGPYSLQTEKLSELFDKEELYFVLERDSCLCSTVFKVGGTRAAPTLLKANAATSGCCQTVDIPVEGARVYDNQHFFPSAILKRYFGSVPEDCCECCAPLLNTSVPACVNSSSDQMYVDVGETTGDCPDVVGVSRNVNGYFTWPIKKRYMDLLVEKINFILECSKNDGLKPLGSGAPSSVTGGGSGKTLSMYGSLYLGDRGIPADGWFKQGSTCSTQQIDQWLASLRYEGTILGTERGTLVFGSDPQISVVSRTRRGNTNSTVESRSPSTTITVTPYNLLRPWEVKVSADGGCSNDLPKVYAYTLNKLDELVEQISQRVWPYGTFNDFTYSGTCDEAETIGCCRMDLGYLTTSRRECEKSGGTEVVSQGECNDLIAAVCPSKFGRNCGVDVPCFYDQGSMQCICPDGCYEYWQCCCPNNSGGSQCQQPSNSLILQCDCAGGYPATSCESVTVARCCPIGSDDETLCIPPSSDPLSSCPDGYELQNYEELRCEGIPNALPTRYADYVETPEYPQLPPCEDENPCCLKHPAFNAPDFRYCLSYAKEIQDFIYAATNGLIDRCYYVDSRIDNPLFPESPPLNCSEIRCFGVCEEDFTVVSSSIDSCLKQAPIMYSWRNTVVYPEDAAAGWPSSTYYDIIFSAPSTI
jgi:hypothetical protein